MISNDVIGAKTDIALSALTNNGGLKPDYVEQFIMDLVTPAQMLGLMELKPTGAPTYRIPKGRFSNTSNFLHRAVSGQAVAAAQRSAPNLSQNSVTFGSYVLRGETVIPDEIGEDNINGPALSDFIRTIGLAAGRRDLEKVIILGDTTIPFSTNSLLCMLNGLIVEAVTNTYAPSAAYITEGYLTNVELSLPSEFAALYIDTPAGQVGHCHFLSRRAYYQFAQTYARRGTPMGDTVIVKGTRGNDELMHNGYAVRQVALFPETLGSGPNYTTVDYFTNPRNNYVIMHRDITIEKQRDASAGAWKLCVSLRPEQAPANERAIVLGSNVQIAGT